MAKQVDHWLRLNKANRVPRRLVVFDSEARRRMERRAERHDFRLACASFDSLDATGRPEGRPELASFTAPGALWAWVAEHASPQHRLVCFAHRLSYDLRLTAALEHLPALGYKPTRVVLSDYSCWARFARGKRTIMLCDSLSWLPVPLDAIAGDLGMRRPRLPDEAAPAAAWEARCAADVRVLREALLRITAWLSDGQLGDFRPTGPAQASACFRHRFLAPRTVLVHWGGETREAERRAAWTGRAEVWRPGRIKEPVYEYDYTAAYAWIAEREHLPTRLLGPSSQRDPVKAAALPETRAGLYELDVVTETPVVPAELDGRILWPVGAFRTTLWDVELAELLAAGGRAVIRRAWLYEAAPVLRPWARWVLAGLTGEPPGDDPIRRRVLKAWSRSLIGRFGLRYPALEAIRLEDDSDVLISSVWDADRGRGIREIQVGHQVFEQDGLVEGGDSIPQLMSAVMAHARVRLWRLMQAAGEGHVLYVDTDSVLVDAAGADRLEARLRQGHFPGLRLKGSHTGADLRAPRNLDLGQERRVAGLPKLAGRNPDGTFTAEVWESLPAALRRRRPSAVYRLERDFTVGGADFRREHLEGGLSAPYRLEGDALAARRA